MMANELSQFFQYDICAPVAAPLYTASLAYRGVCCQLWCTYIKTCQLCTYDQGLGIPCYSACMLCKLAHCLLTQLVAWQAHCIFLVRHLQVLFLCLD